MKQIVSIIGVPMWFGQTRYGTNLAPYVIRSTGLIERLSELDIEVIDEGNIPTNITRRFRRDSKNINNIKIIVRSCERLADRVSNAIKMQRFPLIIGGDHSIALGSIAGAAKQFNRLGVIWFDAHADINTPETTFSGNIHGMPLAACMGLGYHELTSICGYQGKVKPENIVLIGIRDVDEGELLLIARKNIKVYTAKDVQKLGIEQVITETIEYLAERCDGIHLSLDLDGIDPREIMGVGTPAANGISYNDSVLAMKILLATGKITSAEFVEVNPILDVNNITVELTVDLICSLFGEKGKDTIH